MKRRTRIHLKNGKTFESVDEDVEKNRITSVYMDEATSSLMGFIEKRAWIDVFDAKADGEIGNIAFIRCSEIVAFEMWDLP